MATPTGATPWDQNTEILDRLDEHARLRKAGMSRKAIMEVQKVSPETYADDENRIRELGYRKAQDSATEVFSLVMIEHWDWIGRLREIAYSPTSEAKDQVAAAGKAATLLWQIAKLMRIAPETGEPAWNGQQQVPAGGVTLNDNRQVHIFSDAEMMAEFETKLRDFEQRFQPMSDDERRRLLGSDNFKPSGEVWGDGSSDDDDDEED